MDFELKFGLKLNKNKLTSYIGLLDEQVMDYRAKGNLKVEFVIEYLELEHALFINNKQVIIDLIKEL